MVKLADIANETGYSIYTVSCALRDRGRISNKVRAQIKATARDMGYTGNAAASILAMQKKSATLEGKQMSIGWIGRMGGEHSYYYGFDLACQELGYDGVCISAMDFTSAKSMVRVLWHRGIQGVILDTYHSTWTEIEWANADWDLLSVVKISRVHPALSFHHIRHGAFEYMLYTLNKVYQHGYRRLAVLLVSSMSDLDNTTRIGAVLAFQRHHLKQRTRCSVFIHELEHLDESGTMSQDSLDFLREVRPDAVIAFPYIWIYGLRQAGYRIPEDMAFATPLSSVLYDSGTPTTGCDPQTIEVGRRAVYRLHTLIQTGERGMSPHFLQDVVDPIWVDGGTLPVRHACDASIHT